MMSLSSLQGRSGLHSPACPRRVAPHRCSPLCQGLKKAEQRACTEQLQEQKELLNSIKRELQTAQRPLEAGTLQQVVTSLQDASSSLEALAEQSLSSSSSSSSSESECEEMDPLAATRAQIAEAATLQEHISPSVQAELPTAEPSASGRVMVSFSPDGGVSLAGTPEHAVGQVRVCQGKTCSKRGAGDVLMQLGEQAAAVPGIEVAACKCLDRCKAGPNVEIRQPGQNTEIVSRGRPSVVGNVVPNGVVKKDKKKGLALLNW